MSTTGQMHITGFIRHLLAATANASLYGMAHPQVRRLTSDAFESLLKALEDRQAFSLLVIDNELVVEGVPQEQSLFMGRFVQILTTRGIGHVKISAGISRQEVEGFIAGLARQGDSSHGMVSSEHLRLGRVKMRQEEEGAADPFNPRIKIPEMPAHERAHFMDIYETVKKRRKLHMTGISEIVSGFVDVFRQEGKPLMVMAALRETDEYTFTHSTNVCILNMAQAMAMGIEGQMLNDIGIAAMLHDIGKLFVPEEILVKKGSLTLDEIEIMRKHPTKGARYLMDAPGVPRLAISTAFEHHMKFNFNGYPKVPAGWQQNLCSQMTNISDVFDALRTRRPYHEPMELPEIANIMLNIIGTDLHPVLTRNFLKIISRLMEDLKTSS
ncbi:HD-GYP domain-containing protein [Pelotalea chapellei]|uniref:HD domain-containing protein n=1 Tax=Pelotalea chapellei TaxID=44671 RepID=A0ABS5UBP1_9BACT|nr:HD domain-containing phosphohydrolase [Pelotalea chapellei]MBT1073100.1 HD domain-containing protein [Pelotalea chapellei]